MAAETTSISSQPPSPSNLPTLTQTSEPYYQDTQVHNPPPHKPACTEESESSFHTWLSLGWVDHRAMDTTPQKPVPWTTPDSESPPQLRYYSGVTAFKHGAGQLSLFYELEGGGIIEEDGPDIREIRKHEGGLKQLKTMMKPGLAAVCLEFPKNARELARRLSGFRLRRDGVDVVITCAHFATWPSIQQDFDEKARAFTEMEKHPVIALQARMVDKEDADDYSRHVKLNLQLIAIHRPWDLAIFRIVEKTEDDEEKQVINWNQMHFVTPEDRGKLGTKDLWWSVGYNLSNDMSKLQTSWKAFFLRQPSKVQADIYQKYKFDATTTPNLKFLAVSQRTVSFGTLEQFAPTGEEEQTYQVSISISAWYGRSGSMVCTRENGGVDGRENQVSVHGIIKGGSTKSDYNVMILFEENMKSWLDKALSFHPDESEHPVDFSERFIMA
ncbi:uncharacterized protein PV06_07060 [Exophiala oligosperma]|uniref:Uncharacterized protein n=1 Tax=Exophiala oligosperma TaxID=215243 RepID=A0A0D2DGL2_9EURO|nr:uncharacterized protein PV06_07060 [Exophiala oligosperma]KIW41510.1 hypothetical protein PV06_07060 [Exophiala oligosperma]